MSRRAHRSHSTRKPQALLTGFSASATMVGVDTCGRGHPYTPENTYIHPTRGDRECRECRKLRRGGLKPDQRISSSTQNKPCSKPGHEQVEFYDSNAGRYRMHCKQCYEAVHLRSRQKLYDAKRQKIIQHYGGRCACCGETEFVFLQLDHINGGGNEHRRQIGTGGGVLLQWIINNNYPEGFRVLCANCNSAWARGWCPHESPTTRRT